MCECTFSFIQWKNRVRTITFEFGFCSDLYGVGFGSFRFLAHFLLSGSVRFLGKPEFLFGSFLLCSDSFPSLTCMSHWHPVHLCGLGLHLVVSDHSSVCMVCSLQWARWRWTARVVLQTSVLVVVRAVFVVCVVVMTTTTTDRASAVCVTTTTTTTPPPPFSDILVLKLISVLVFILFSIVRIFILFSFIRFFGSMIILVFIVFCMILVSILFSFFIVGEILVQLLFPATNACC